MSEPRDRLAAGGGDEAVLRTIPAINTLLGLPQVRAAALGVPRVLVLRAAQQVTANLRAQLRQSADPAARNEPPPGGLDEVAGAICAEIHRLARASLRRVINATGVVVHTNLGRSPLAEQALAAVTQVARGYSNLELSLDSGERGQRDWHVEGLLKELCGAEAAMVVNNDAAAVLLALGTLAAGREVVVSRGELVEIGGSFRVPDVMAASGARLVEVGTTNRTHLADYARAVGPNTAVVMKVHTSNYRIVGFTAAVGLSDLASLCRDRNVLLLDDVGSGLLVELAIPVLRGEPTVKDRVAQGADLVMFSGDKLLGGPQAGILVGRQDLIAKLRKNPLTRALRCDKLCLSALEATLRLYLDADQALAHIPTLRALSSSNEALLQRATALAELLLGGLAATGQADGTCEVAVEAGESQVGGGALPAQALPTQLVTVRTTRPSATSLEASLRAGEPAIVARVNAGRVVFDSRTLTDEDVPVVAAAVLGALGR